MIRKILILCMLVSLFAGMVHAEDFWACFSQGEQIDFCNPKVNDRTCSVSSGCKLCMSSYDEATDCWNQGNWNMCSVIPGGGCSTWGGGTIDSQPPELTLHNPLKDNSSIFTSTSIVFNFSLDERADVYYIDINNDRGRWTKVCDSCQNYERSRRFDEGFNQLSIRAVDAIGNDMLLGVEFFIDSREPRVSKTLPRSGNSDGNFYVEFTEANLASVTLTYGSNNFGFQEIPVDINTCYEPRRGRMACDVFADVKTWEGRELTYWFNVTDIVGNSDLSDPRTIDGPLPGWGIMPELDLIEPLNGSLHTDTKVPLVFTVTEPAEVSYIDNNDDRGRWNRVCRDCMTFDDEERFDEGFNNLTFRTTDPQGDVVYDNVYFFIDSREPKISGTEPRRGYTSGDFVVEFTEANPAAITLYYGNETETRTAPGDLGSCAEVRRGRLGCTASVNLDDFEGQEVQYWFEVEDIVGNTDQSRIRDGLMVDQVDPVINDLNIVLVASRVEFYLNITEKNFDEALYWDEDSSRPSWRRLCTRLDEFGTCEARKTFSDGDHTVIVKVFDDAGNTAEEAVSFTVY